MINYDGAAHEGSALRQETLSRLAEGKKVTAEQYNCLIMVTYLCFGGNFFH